MGRTRLLQHVAGLVRDHRRFAFVDFSRTAARASHQILAGLCASPGERRAKDYTRYAVSRFKIAHLQPGPGPSPVVVLDDIQQVTGPRLRFLRRLATDSSCRLVAVVDASVPDHDLLCLQHLPPGRVAEFLRHYSRRCGFGWSESRILTLARSTGGYPPAMVEVVLRQAGKAGLVTPDGKRAP